MAIGEIATDEEIAGAEDTYGPHSKQQDSREIMGKYGVHHDHKEA